MGGRIQCNGATWVGSLADGGGTSHVEVCDLGRSVRIDATDNRRGSWSITYPAEGIEA